MYKGLQARLVDKYRYFIKMEDARIEMGLSKKDLEMEIGRGKLEVVGEGKLRTADIVRYLEGDVQLGFTSGSDFSGNILPTDITKEELKEMIGNGVGEGSVFYNKKRGKWQIAFSLGYNEKGKRKRKIITAENKEEAMRLYLEYKIGMGKEILREKTIDEVRKEKITVIELIELWIKEESRLIEEKDITAISKATLGGYEGMYRKRIKGFFEGNNIFAEDVDNKAIREFLEAVRKNDVGNIKEATVKKHLYPVSNAFQYGEEEGLIDINPFNNYVHRGKSREVEKGRDSIDSETAKDFMAEVKGHPFELIYHLAFLYGLRRGEVLGLKWEDIDMEKDTVTICRSRVGDGKSREIRDRTKGGEVQKYPLHPSLKIFLVKHKEKQEKDARRFGLEKMDKGFVCGVKLPKNTKVSVPTGGYVSRIFKEIMEGLGKEHVLHEVRHTVATVVFDGTNNILAAQQYLRHQESRTTEIYIHGQTRRVEEGMEVAGKFYEEITNDEK